MTTFFQPGGPQAGGQQYGTSAEPQQYYPTAGYPPAPAPQVDFHHPYPAYQPEQAAWSQPIAQPVFQPLSSPVSQYQPPSWPAPTAGPNRNKVVAALIAVALLLVAGAVALIVVLNKGDGAAPVNPQVPNPSAPVVAGTTPAGATPAGPVQPQPFPSATTGPTPDAPTVPAQTVPAPTVPEQTVPAQTTPAQPANVPGQQDAEQVAGGFVSALRSSDFTGAANYICSAKAAAFAAGASQLSSKVQLETMQLSDVAITGSTAVMTMTYQAIGADQTLNESLPMTVESGTWKICN